MSNYVIMVYFICLTVGLFSLYGLFIWLIRALSKKEDRLYINVATTMEQISKYCEEKIEALGNLLKTQHNIIQDLRANNQNDKISSIENKIKAFESSFYNTFNTKTKQIDEAHEGLVEWVKKLDDVLWPQLKLFDSCVKRVDSLEHQDKRRDTENSEQRRFTNTMIDRMANVEKQYTAVVDSQNQRDTNLAILMEKQDKAREQTRLDLHKYIDTFDSRIKNIEKDNANAADLPKLIAAFKDRIDILQEHYIDLHGITRSLLYPSTAEAQEESNSQALIANHSYLHASPKLCAKCTHFTSNDVKIAQKCTRKRMNPISGAMSDANTDCREEREAGNNKCGPDAKFFLEKSK